jgi:hypothetical protein
MNVELQDKLFKNYPKIFKQKDLSMQDTCMCWGIECGDGLYWLINLLCEQLQNDIDYSKSPQIEATQVKEKFGRLCFYVNEASEKQQGIIDFAQTLSLYICHKCGTTQHVGQTSNWTYTECKDCIQKNDRAKYLIWKEHETN